MIDLGTLGGYESLGIYVNNGGQVIGFATINGTPDPYSFLGAPTHTFIWQNGAMLDLGTLGGPDSFPSNGGVNDRNGSVAGGSYTNSIPNPVTGIPTQDPFLWRNGQMLDLGTLGGTNGFAAVANSQGQVVGQSNLAGDLTYHPFLWDKKKGLTDLGTFGGSNGLATWINDAGEVVGEADFPGDATHDAFLWRRGVLLDLGNLGVTVVLRCDPNWHGQRYHLPGQSSLNRHSRSKEEKNMKSRTWMWTIVLSLSAPRD